MGAAAGGVRGMQWKTWASCIHGEPRSLPPGCPVLPPPAVADRGEDDFEAYEERKAQAEEQRQQLLLEQQLALKQQQQQQQEREPEQK